MGRLEAIRLWWESTRTRAAVSDDELRSSTRQVTKAIVQTLRNRELNRPELRTGAPASSASEQRAYDRETVARFEDAIAPTVADLRREYVARGAWDAALDARFASPAGVDDLRALVLRLDALAAEL